MQFIIPLLPFIQLILSILLITAILLQARGSSLGGALGGGDAGTTFYTRRGGEKALFNATIVLSLLFVVTAFIPQFL